MIKLSQQEVRDALADVGVTGPVTVRLTDGLNRLIEQKIHAALMENDPLNVLLREEFGGPPEAAPGEQTDNVRQADLADRILELPLRDVPRFVVEATIDSIADYVKSYTKKKS